jgi:integrase
MTMAKKRRARGEGSIFFKASRGEFVGRVQVGRTPEGKPRYKEVMGKTRGEVLASKRALEADVRAGRPVGDGPLSLADWLDHWLAHSVSPSAAPSTYRSYESNVRNHIKPRLGGYTLYELRSVHVERFFSELMAAGMSAGNCKKVSEVLSAALSHAQRLGVAGANVSAPVPKPRPRAEGELVFTDREVQAVLRAASGLRLEALVAVAFGSGAREGELLGLGWEHVDFAAATVFFTRSLGFDKRRGGFYLKDPKSARGRRLVRLPAFALAALGRHRAAMLREGNLGGPVFCTRNGNWVGGSNLTRRVWRPLLAAAGVGYKKFHAVRHTHASRLLMDGVSVPEVARPLGDAQETVIRTYSHYLPSAAAEIASKLDAFYTA